MATLESMAIRSDTALDRIEKQLAKLGVEVDTFPRLNRESEMLRCIQLEQIADAIESVKPVTKRGSNKVSK